jgi:cytochrome c5
MNARAIALCTVALAGSHIFAQATHQQQQPKVQQQTKASPVAHSNSQTSTDGQEVFQQNCARCHNAPETFSPSISGTVAHHMRVRANLSEEQYKALLTFLNP